MRAPARARVIVAAMGILMGGCASVQRVALHECEIIASGPGPEDIEIDTTRPDQPRLIASLQERRVRNRDGSFHYAGEIVGVPLTGPERGRARSFVLTGRDRTAFHPHGISLVQTAAQTFLYVINHAGSEGSRIEVFAVEGDRLVLQPSPPSTPLLSSPNDLVALPDGQIYVTNMTRHPRGALGLVELLLGFRLGSVVHFKDGAWRVAASGIAYANGIAITPSGTRVFIAGTRKDGLHVYHREPTTGELTEDPRASIRVGKGVDNLTWEDPGKTLIAARHTCALAFLRHASKPDVPSPSMIQRIDVDTGHVSTVFATDGTDISALSVGLVFDGRLYLGQVFNEGLLACRLR